MVWTSSLAIRLDSSRGLGRRSRVRGARRGRRRRLDASRLGRALDLLGLDQDRDHGASDETEGPVTDGSEQSRDGARMGGHGDVGAVVMREDVVQQLLQTGGLRGVALAEVRAPERVLFGEAGFEGVGRVRGVDDGLGLTTVTGVDADGLTQELLHLGDERPAAGEVDALECDLGRFEAPRERAGVVTLGYWDLLLSDLLLPEAIGDHRLLPAVVGDVGVIPDYSSVTIQLGPIALYLRTGLFSIR